MMIGRSNLSSDFWSPKYFLSHRQVRKSRVLSNFFCILLLLPRILALKYILIIATKHRTNATLVGHQMERRKAGFMQRENDHS
ncbi:hypothetical protein VTL71DRAFT_7950 [Oculimacula yallundae]|uniref:Uncharacterized protein n=1 Tax=Oculimacula yallundae TaxID=86028 RepID=A0ABR4CWG8_9HELO